MEPFKGIDFFEIESQFAQDEIMVRDMVREFVTAEVIPIIDDHYEKGTFPYNLVPRMAELGLFGPTLPEEYGGSNLNNVAYGLITQELERGDSGLRSFVSVQSALVMWPIFTYGSDEQKRRYLPPMARGEIIGSFGLTEPDFGSDPAGMLTRAERKGDGWLLNGAKMWITNATCADVSLVWAKSDEGVLGFLVDKDTPGYSAPEQKKKMSLRASVTSEIILEDCYVPDSARLPKVKGMRGPLTCLTQARYGIAWGAIGAAMECFHTAVEYSKSRIQFSKPIAAFQLTQKKLAEMLTEITKAQLICLHLGRLKDRGKADYVQISFAKRNNVEMALEVARTARNILGANGISLEYPVIRHMMNLESVYTYEGTHEIHTLILGERITGIPAYE